MNRRKMLILDDCSSLLEKLRLNIRRYDVVPAATLDQAMELLSKEDISFIVADIKLESGKKGYHVFKQLFSKGKLVPGIVFTAFVVDGKTKDELADMGIPETIEKTGVMGKLSSRIESAADAILASHKQRLSLLTAKISSLGLGDRVIAHGGQERTIENWLDRIFAGKYSIEEENVLRDLMVQECNRHLAPDGQPHNFPPLGALD